MSRKKFRRQTKRYERWIVAAGRGEPPGNIDPREKVFIQNTCATSSISIFIRFNVTTANLCDAVSRTPSTYTRRHISASTVGAILQVTHVRLERTTYLSALLPLHRKINQSYLQRISDRVHSYFSESNTVTSKKKKIFRQFDTYLKREIGGLKAIVL